MLDKLYSSISDYLHTGQDNILQNKKLIDIANNYQVYIQINLLKYHN